MTREEVREAMPEAPFSFKKTPMSDHTTDAFHKNGFQVFYAGDTPKVDYIELSRGSGFRALFRGIDVFSIPADELVPMLTQHAPFDENLRELGYAYVFPAFDLAVWRPVLGESPEDIEGWWFLTIGIGVKGYFTR